jgi:cellulose biosynthesis protein BcsQ
MQMLE